MQKNSDWWRGAVIYQIYPRSFADANGDGVGDLPGIVARLPYVASLGVDAIWVSPFYKSPMKDFGYDVADYRAVDPLFGSLEDFDRLVATAHGLGLKVMIDQVPSHCSDQHPWFVESRASRTNAKADWFVWADPKADGTPPNNWLSVFGGSAWQWDTRRRQYYLHNFLASQPDLNFHHPDVQAATLDNIRFWLDRGVDGLRFDACNFHFHDRQLRNNPPAAVRDSATVSADNPYGLQAHRYDKTQPENLDFLRRVRALLDEYGAAAVGEVGDDDNLATMAAYTQGGDKLHMAYSFALLTPDFAPAYVRDQVAGLERIIGDGWACWSMGNHDVPRVATRWGHVPAAPCTLPATGAPGIAASRGVAGDAAPAFAKMALAMLLSLRGSACLYQGDELGLPEADVPYALLQDPYGLAFWPEFKGRDGCRTPMPWQGEVPHGGFTSGTPWLPVPPAHRRLAVDRQERDPASVLAFYRQFIAWRKQQPALLAGRLCFRDSGGSLLAFEREVDGQRLLAVFNLGGSPAEFPLAAGDQPSPLVGHGLMVHGLMGEVANGRVHLPAHGAFLAALGTEATVASAQP